MNKTNRIAILIFLTPIIAAFLYSLYYRESRRSLMERLVDSGVIALLEGDMVTRNDLRDYFQHPPIEENEILRSLEITPEDVKGIGLHEKDRELFQEQTGQLLLYQVIKHIALIKYLQPSFDDENAMGDLQQSIDAYRESLMIEAMESDLAKVSPSVTQEEMLAHYLEHSRDFYRQGKRYSRHIMLYDDTHSRSNGNPFALTPDQVWTRLQNGEDFYSLIVETRSENSPQEGILGWLPRGTLHQNFEKALWALDIGEITGPIRINSTIHFIQLLDEQPEGLIPFNECRGQIKTLLKEQKKTLHRYKLLGLNPESLSTGTNEQSDRYRKALLEAAYAREWHTNMEIVSQTEAYSKYQKANWVFQQEMNRRREQRISSRNENSTWILESKTASSLLKQMDFRLLLKLDISANGTIDREIQEAQ